MASTTTTVASTITAKEGKHTNRKSSGENVKHPKTKRQPVKSDKGFPSEVFCADMGQNCKKHELSTLSRNVFTNACSRTLPIATSLFKRILVEYPGLTNYWMNGLDLLEAGVVLSEGTCTTCWVKRNITDVPVLMLYICMMLDENDLFVKGVDSVLSELGSSELQSKSFVQEFIKRSHQ
jgi:hypothetical protein